MSAKQSPPCGVSKFHVDQEKGFARGANLGLDRHDAKAGPQLMNQGQIGTVRPSGLDQKLNALLIHLKEWSQRLLKGAIDLHSRL